MSFVEQNPVIFEQAWQENRLEPESFFRYGGLQLSPVTLNLNGWVASVHFRADIDRELSFVYVNGALLGKPEQGFDMSAGGRYVFSFDLVDRNGCAVNVDEVVYDMDPKPQTPVTQPSVQEEAAQKPAASKPSASAAKPSQSTGGYLMNQQTPSASSSPAASSNQQASASKQEAPVKQEPAKSPSASSTTQSTKGSSGQEPANNSQTSSSQKASGSSGTSNQTSSWQTSVVQESVPVYRQEHVIVQTPVYQAPAEVPLQSPQQTPVVQESEQKEQKSEKADKASAKHDKQDDAETSKKEESQQDQQKQKPAEKKETQNEPDQQEAVTVLSDTAGLSLMGSGSFKRHRFHKILSSTYDSSSKQESFLQSSLEKEALIFVSKDGQGLRLCLESEMKDASFTLNQRPWIPVWQQDANGLLWARIPEAKSRQVLEVQTSQVSDQASKTLSTVVFRQVLDAQMPMRWIGLWIHGAVGLLSALWMAMVQRK